MSTDVVLCLDMATRTGWGLVGFGGELHDYGAFRCNPTKRGGSRWTRFRDGLTVISDLSMAKGLTIAAIAAEMPISGSGRGRSAAASRVAWGLAAHLDHWAEPVEVTYIARATCAKRVAGNGRAPKDAVAIALDKRWPGRGLHRVAVHGPWDETDALAVGVTWLVDTGRVVD